jgi:hypothetical protein
MTRFCIFLEVHESQADSQYHKTITCPRCTKWSYMILTPRVQFQSSPCVIRGGRNGIEACFVLQGFGVSLASYHSKSTPVCYLSSNRPLRGCSTMKVSLTPLSHVLAISETCLLQEILSDTMFSRVVTIIPVDAVWWKNYSRILNTLRTSYAVKSRHMVYI